MWITYHPVAASSTLALQSEGSRGPVWPLATLKQAFQNVEALLDSALAQTETALNILLESPGAAAVLLPAVMASLHKRQAGSVHLAVQLNFYLTRQFWSALAAIFCDLPSYRDGALRLAGCDLLDVPGMQRFDLQDGRWSLTIAHALEQDFSRQWLAAFDGFLRWQPPQSAEHDDVSVLRPAPLYLKKAAREAWLISNCDPEPVLQQHCREMGLRCVRTAAAQPAQVEAACPAKRPVLYELHSRRPPLSFNRWPQHKSAGIIGAGLAGAAVAEALVRRGWEITVFDAAQQSSPSSRHAGHAAAAMVPYGCGDDNFKARLSRLGILRAHDCWRDLPDEVLLGTGALEVDTWQGWGQNLIQGVAQQKLSTRWVQRLSAEELSRRAGRSGEGAGVYWPYAWHLSPEKLVAWLLRRAGSRIMPKHVTWLRPRQAGWEVGDAYGSLGCFAQVVLANAAGASDLLQRNGLHLAKRRNGTVRCPIPLLVESMHLQGGQVMHVPAHTFPAAPKVMLDKQGYILPPAQGICVVGSSYERGIADPELSAVRQLEILQKTGLELELASHVPFGGWSGHRAIVRDRLPVIGPLPHAPGLWVAAAYASHGLTWACLGGELIASALEGEPLCAEFPLWRAVQPR